MLKLPKGLKKKKKGKKSKRKGEDELFTEEELDKYRKEHQQHQAVAGEGSVKENEEWSKFQNLTKGIDSVLKQTQGDLDRIKSTSFFQRIPAGVKEVDRTGKEKEKRRAQSPPKPVVEVTEADFPQLAAAAASAEADDNRSEYGVTDDESEEDEQDDIFDTSFVEAVERGEVKLTYVPDSPEQTYDDDIFDTSHVDVLIKGQEAKSSKGKKALDIGVAVEVLTGRIDNLTLTTTKKSKRVIPGDLLLEGDVAEAKPAVISKVPSPTAEKSILDVDEDIPISTPIDLSVSLHTVLIQNKQKDQEDNTEDQYIPKEEEDDEFTKLAAESLEVGVVTRIKEEEIKVEPVVEDSWSAFEADKNDKVFAEGIVEDQLDVDLYYDQDDPFDTSFVDPSLNFGPVAKETIVLSDDDDFDPRADEVRVKLNNRRKSSVKIHLTDPSGVRESITSDDIIEKEATQISRDLLGGSTTDLSQLGDCPLDPIDINNVEDEIDPFDTTIVDKIVAPGKVELKLLEKELIGNTPAPVPVYRVPSDPDFDPRAEESDPVKVERRASRPENLIVNKSVIFNVDIDADNKLDAKSKSTKPVTPYYTRELSITEDVNDETEAADTVTETLKRTQSDENLAPKATNWAKRRYSEFNQPKQVYTHTRPSELLEIGHSNIQAKVLTPILTSAPSEIEEEQEIDPFDTSFTGHIEPSKTELKLLAKEFSCEETKVETEPDLLAPDDDLFQVKALTPEPTVSQKVPEDIDPFDTSFASDLQPGRTELKLLESEFLK